MRNRTHTLEEESFFPSITDLMVGIIFIFIIIVMALILQIKDEQQVIPKPLFDKISNLTEQEKTELDILIDERDDIDQRVKELANEKIKNNKLNQQILEANIIIENQNETIAILNEEQKKIDKIFDDLGLEVLKNEELTNQLIDLTKTNEKLLSELDLLERDINNKNTELLNLDKQINNLNDKITEIPILEEEILTLNTKIESFLEINNSNQNIRDQLDLLIDENISLKKEIEISNKNNQEIDQIILTKNKLEEQNYVLDNEISKLKNEIKILENKDKNQIANTIDIINEYKEEAVKTLLNELKLLFKKEKISIDIDYPNSKFILSSKKLFSSGSDKLSQSGIKEIEKIRKIFAQVLPCFTFEPYFLKQNNALNRNKKNWEKLQDKFNHSKYCNSSKMKISKYFKIDTLMIEGHTDQDNAKIADEKLISVKRALNTFNKIAENEYILISALTNKRGEPIFSYSGFGRTRPLLENANTENQKSKNRRLEFRFIFGEPEPTLINEIINELKNAS